MTARCGSGVTALSGSGTGMGQYRPAGPLKHRPAGPLDPAVTAPVRRQAEPLKSQPASGGNADTRIHHPAPQRRKSGSHRAWYKRRHSGSTQEAIPKGSTIRNPVLSIILCGTPLGRSNPLDLVITFCTRFKEASFVAIQLPRLPPFSFDLTYGAL